MNSTKLTGRRLCWAVVQLVDLVEVGGAEARALSDAGGRRPDGLHRGLAVLGEGRGAVVHHRAVVVLRAQVVDHGQRVLVELVWKP